MKVKFKFGIKSFSGNAENMNFANYKSRGVTIGRVIPEKRRITDQNITMGEKMKKISAVYSATSDLSLFCRIACTLACDYSQREEKALFLLPLISLNLRHSVFYLHKPKTCSSLMVYGQWTACPLNSNKLVLYNILYSQNSGRLSTA